MVIGIIIAAKILKDSTNYLTKKKKTRKLRF